MGLFLGVAQGSDEPLRFIHLIYTPEGDITHKVGVLLLLNSSLMQQWHYWLGHCSQQQEQQQSAGDAGGAAAVLMHLYGTSSSDWSVCRSVGLSRLPAFLGRTLAPVLPACLPVCLLSHPAGGFGWQGLDL
jgi:hypothetical protein